MASVRYFGGLSMTFNEELQGQISACLQRTYICIIYTSHRMIFLYMRTGPLLLILEPQNVTTTQRKSCLTNLLPVSNLIFDPCIKVQLGHHIEKAFYLPYCCPWAFHGQTTSSFS